MNRDPSENGINPQQNGIGQNRKSKTPEEIEAEIAQTRNVISEDISALSDKLSAENLRAGAKGVMHDAKQEARELVREAKDAAVDSLRSAKDSAVDSLRSAKDSAVESVAEVVHEIGDGARRAGTVTGRFVSTNAIPLGLIGLGVAWLTVSMRRRRTLERDYRYAEFGAPDYGYRRESRGDYEYEASPEVLYDEPTSTTHLGEIGPTQGRTRPPMRRAKQRIADASERAAESIGDVGDKARERLGNAAHRVADAGAQLQSRARERMTDMRYRANELSHDARDGLRRAQVGARDFAEENPLAVGAVAIAAGVGVGLMLPATRRENKLLGPTRSRLMDEGSRLLGEARDTAERVRDTVKDTAKSTAQELKSSLADPR
ncbi:MAG TPA: DUF3618 domain-containing protein [Polyangiaceae bacterium]